MWRSFYNRNELGIISCRDTGCQVCSGTGYGCDVQTVPSATVPAVASLSENGEPDIVTEMWTNGGGPAYVKLRI
jgi:hypothetical protein